MALIADIRVNQRLIGRLVCVRKVDGVVNEYDCSAVLTEHPATGAEIDTPIVRVEHPFEESAYALIHRAIEGLGLAGD